MSLCPVCDNKMIRRKTWIESCPTCDFLLSSLEPGGGAQVMGLELLRRKNFNALLERVERILPLSQSRILEVGCSTGWFLTEASNRGAEVHAIEPEDTCAEIARSRGFSVEGGFFPNDLLDQGPYDVIVFNDVYEHLPKPTEALAACERLLKPKGILLLNLPSSKGIFYRLANLLDKLGFSGPLERLWQVGLSSPHLTYFNPSNLQAFLTRHSELDIIESGTLDSLTRSGLWARVSSTGNNLSAKLMFCGLYASTFVLRVLPKDIQYILAQRQ